MSSQDSNVDYMRIVKAYFKSLEQHRKFNFASILEVDTFCKEELRMIDEEIAKVHKLIKERENQRRLEELEGDFND